MISLNSFCFNFLLNQICGVTLLEILTQLSVVMIIDYWF